MENKSFRFADMRAEEKLADFMDHCFYSKLHDLNGDSIQFRRIKDKEGQLEGVDVELHLKDRIIRIDEKASLYYSNAMIPTFAFEIDSIQKGHVEPVQGWFVNDALNADYYMLIWPNLKCKKVGRDWVRKSIASIQEHDFTIVEAVLIEKEKLLMEIQHRGYSANRLMEYARRLRNMVGQSNEQQTEDLDEDIKIVYSGALAEKPINAVVRKSLLLNLAAGVYLISEDGYAKI